MLLTAFWPWSSTSPCHCLNVLCHELFAQEARATPRDEPGDVGWQPKGMGADEQLDIVGLKCRFDHRPVAFRRYLARDVFPTGAHQPHQHLAPPFGTPD